MQHIINAVTRIDHTLDVLYSLLNEDDNLYLKRTLSQLGRQGFSNWLDKNMKKLIHLSRQSPETIIHYLLNNFQRKERLLMLYALFVLLQNARVVLQAIANYELTTCTEDDLPYLAGFAAMFLWQHRPPEYPFDTDNPFQME